MKTLLKVWRGLLALIGMVIIGLHAFTICVTTIPLIVLSGRPRQVGAWIKEVWGIML